MKKMLIFKYMFVLLTSELIEINGKELNKIITNYRNFIKDPKNLKTEFVETQKCVFTEIKKIQTYDKGFEIIYHIKNLPITLIQIDSEVKEYSDLYNSELEKKFKKHFEYLPPNASNNSQRKDLFKKHHIFDELSLIENVEMCKWLIEKFKKDNEEILILITTYYYLIIKGEFESNKIKFEIEELFRLKETDFKTVDNFRNNFLKFLIKIQEIQKFGFKKTNEALKLKNLVSIIYKDY